MAVTYTNRKGTTYSLCRGVTKTGKTRYFFAREPVNEPVEKVPEGYEISESVNGVVSLAKVRSALAEHRPLDFNQSMPSWTTHLTSRIRITNTRSPKLWYFEKARRYDAPSSTVLLVFFIFFICS
jgi:hypothetical protein